MSLESVEKLMDETQEAREYQREISDMLANNLSLDEEEAVQEELRGLQVDIFADTTPLVLPQPPTTVPVVPETVMQDGPVSEGN